ncbi:Pacifastin domain-containing protein [Caenorhabditis elegans]|uniref:Pacifastin domain-containing protein n=1 Tax=Caenorhabditis elegans TaxID=6239 RepID=D9N128_CAEEL|nr:Pacifastin domain-containing protein [Caenorhabditis elegans]CBO24987.1 Pacifastin domain-containing protein [Caenorhabditis elegans]|eukprot:NP_001256121.1 Uncharacterized protein CELE_K06A4.10 [Caenorhabditis elegans]
MDKIRPSYLVSSLVPLLFRLQYQMNFLVLLLFLLYFFQSTITFKVPPRGRCHVPTGGDCYGCDCKMPATCYKGTCR